MIFISPPSWSISEKAAEAIREDFAEDRRNDRAVIKSAKDESVHALMIDLFSCGAGQVTSAQGLASS